MTMLDVRSGSAVEGVDAQVAQLRQLRQWVMAAPPVGAAEVATNAEQMRAFLKVTRGAAELAIEATRLECTALRRLALCGHLEGVSNHRKAAARWFAEVGDADFENMMQSVEPWAGAIGVHRALARSARDGAAHRTGAAVARGRADPTPCTPRDVGDLAKAAGALLHDFAPAGQPFSVAEVAEALANDLGQSRSLDDPAARAGYIEAVRLALRADTGGAEPTHPDAPAWVTYCEDSLGWVRIPWSSASIDQFRAMLDLRRTQLAELRAVVERLDGVLALCEAASSAHPDSTGCAALIAIALGGEGAG